ncbi:aldehyde dehydrogenase family protein [Kribbella sp. NBC_00482]|uniref:aldehyde dehydrogenase family protein n=1 Tax=Kribbella sp. NBC_00482 TaxID=2975968 RepID=UPI002E1812A5
MSSVILSVVAGERVQKPGRTTRSTNPAQLSDVVGTIGSAGPEVFVQAAEAARSAQAAWAATPAPQRGQVISNVGRLMTLNKDRLAALVTREIGKPLGEALGEVQEIIDTCDFFLGEGRRLYGQTVPSEMPDKQLFTFRRPVGTVAVITAGNFPVAVPSWYIVPALLCGNTVVWKPAEYSTVVSDAFYEIFAHSGVPAGVFNLVYADGPDTFSGLEQALEAGLINKVGFTGSSAVGTRIGELCGRHLQTPCLELGGKNPMVITEDAELDLAVEGALFSGFGTAGQRCTSLGTAIVHRSVYDEFLDRFGQATAGAAMGDPTQDVLFGPLLDEKFAAGFEKSLGWIAAHHRVIGRTGRVTADNPRAGFVGDPATGLFYHPTIVADVQADDELFLNETFGPVVSLTPYSTLDEAIALGNKSGYGLSSSIYTTDPNKAFRFAQGISAGMVSVNNSTSGAEAHLPFGGNGKSGNGSRQSGMWVLDQFTRWQSMNWDYSGKLQKAQMDTETVEADLSFQLP